MIAPAAHTSKGLAKAFVSGAGGFYSRPALHQNSVLRGNFGSTEITAPKFGERGGRRGKRRKDPPPTGSVSPTTKGGGK